MTKIALSVTRIFLCKEQIEDFVHIGKLHVTEDLHFGMFYSVNRTFLIQCCLAKIFSSKHCPLEMLDICLVFLTDSWKTFNCLSHEPTISKLHNEFDFTQGN